MVKPRLLHLPYRSKASDLGDEAVGLARSAGLKLDEWQAFVLENSLTRKRNGDWRYFEIGVDVARQNGKDGIMEARELAGLYLIKEQLLIHSAHQFDTSLEHFHRLRYLIEDSDHLNREVKRITRSHGEEGIELTQGRRIRFRTRTKGGGRGFSCDCLLLNEAMEISEASHGALLPTLSARENPQVWYAGSAVDQLVHQHGVVFARVRERGLKGDDPSLAWFEWSVEGDNPATLNGELTDRAAWAQANPALGIRINVDHVERELRSMDPRTFAVERLGVGDWPRTDHVATSPLDFDTWSQLVDVDSQVQGPVAFAFDVSPERRGSISVAGPRADGLLHVEVVEDKGGTGWIPDRLQQLVLKHNPIAVVCDGYGPAASLVDVLERVGIVVTTLSASDHTQGCARLVDAVEEGKLRHLGQPQLDAAVKAAATRPLGDAWAWSRKGSAANISPLVSVTLAHSAASVPATLGGGVAY